ncbi:MAG: glycoside hydrolase family 97 N-terminal domain-containing protein [Polyangia bacterium]
MRRLLFAPTILALLLGLGTCAPTVKKGAPVVPSQGWKVTSPSGLLTMEVRRFSPTGTPDYPTQPRLYYRVVFGGGEAKTELLRWSPLGITRQDADFTDDLRYLGESQRRVADDYTLPRGKRSHFSNAGVEHVLSFETPQKARLDLVVRAYDDGLAFRYHFPEASRGPFTITSEATGFRFMSGARAILLPQSEPGAAQNQGATAEWMADLPAGTAPPAGTHWSLPALFASPDKARWVLLAESGLAAGHAALGLAGKADGEIYRLRFPHPDEEAGRGEVQPKSSLPWSTPWRVLIVSDGLAGIVESSLATDLGAPAATGTADWIRPGSVVRQAGASGLDRASLGPAVHLVEIAASMGWGYSLLSAQWPSGGGSTWRKLVRAAANKKVGLLIGPQNAARLPLAEFATAGLKGVRVAVSASGKPDVVASLLALLEEAGKRHLLVAFEGRISGAGWDRTYPHLLSASVGPSAAAERDGASQARQNTIDPYTRNVVGPMEPTPVAFHDPARPSPLTWGHQLGLTVVFESGLRSFVESNGALPREAVSLLSALPSAWDETRLLHGDPGHSVIMARRKDRTWYVAGLNGDAVAKTHAVPMELLGTGLFDMVLVADGPSATDLLITKRQRNATDVQSIKVAPYGGFLMRLVPQN